jgi:hypothetical protein
MGLPCVSQVASPPLASYGSPSHARGMFVVVFEQRGEFSAAVELRRLFAGITANAVARECARTIASWGPLPWRRYGGYRGQALEGVYRVAIVAEAS